ncbi:hypothetical protein JQ595_34090 [Bradyrhizobium japonicum]|uniref:hypothetical protein n=1 Tax=Bradyrhizobium japonicum TaxID=375 RepID=UPI001BA6951C|nr:hypothetical protein [Bradyrhizobium japonicum]MBR0733787.1 hypothetical protein [Bradyrhizobium japonicum]
MIAAQDEIFQSPVCIVSIREGNAAATVIAAICKLRQVGQAGDGITPRGAPAITIVYRFHGER